MGNLRRFFSEGTPRRSRDWERDFIHQVFAIPEGKLLPGPGNLHCPWLHLADLAIHIHVFLLDRRTLRSVLQPPRGKAATMSQTTRRVEITLGICRDLMGQSRASGAVQGAITRMREIMAMDPQLLGYLDSFDHHPDAVTIALAQRWLRRRGVAVDLIGQAPDWHSPRTILQRYLFKKGQYGEHTESMEKSYKKVPSLRQYVTEVWMREYLSP